MKVRFSLEFSQKEIQSPFLIQKVHSKNAGLKLRVFLFPGDLGEHA